MEQTTPDYENIAYVSMTADIKLNRDISNGQNKLRNSTYLPKYDGESDLGYQARLKTSYLNNKLNEKIATSAGLILNKEITTENVPEYIENDIDGNNTTIDQFALLLLKEGEIDGHSFILVDAPSTTPASLADQEQNNIHPYWLNVIASQVINWLFSSVDGDSQLTQVTIKELVTEQNGRFGEVQIEQLKVFNLENKTVFYELWRKDSTTGQFAIYQESTATSFKTIPLVPFYTNKTGNMTSRPPYMNVANNTLNAFQLGSQKNRALKQIGDPDKAIFSDSIQNNLSNADEENGVNDSTLTFGADIAQVFGTEDKYMFVEPTGKGVELLGLEIDKIETISDGMGAELEQVSGMTATEASIKSTRATAEDVVFSINLEQALNEALRLTAEVDSSVSSEAVIKLSRDFAESELTDQEITVLNNMVMSGNLSKVALLEAIGKGEMPKFITEEQILEELERIQDENIGAIEEIE